MPQTATHKPAPHRKTGWTPERRARQAARIRLWAPWGRSTGPKTLTGKAKSARNAYKHGGRSHNMRLFLKALSAQSRFRRSVSAYMAARKENNANELLDRWRRRLVLEGRTVTRELKKSLIALDFLERVDP